MLLQVLLSSTGTHRIVINRTLLVAIVLYKHFQEVSTTTTLSKTWKYSKLSLFLRSSVFFLSFLIRTKAKNNGYSYASYNH